MNLFNQVEWGAKIASSAHELVVAELLDPSHLVVHGAHVGDGLNDIACTSLTLGTDHGRAFTEAAERFTQVASSAHEWGGEGPLVDVMFDIGRSENFGLVDVVNAEGLQDPSLQQMSDPAFGHHRNGHRLLDLLDLGGVGHTGHTTSLADVGGDPLERSVFSGLGARRVAPPD
jgi:hypothetical protein